MSEAIASIPANVAVIGIETPVTDYIYDTAPNADLRDEFLKSLFPKNPPRKGDNLMVSLEELEDSLLVFADQKNLTLTGETDAQKVISARDQIFGTPRTIQAGGALANSMHILVHNKVDGKPLAPDTVFLTAVGNDDAGQVFRDSLKGAIAHPDPAGRTMTAHILPLDGDRIIIACPSQQDSCNEHLKTSLKMLKAADFSSTKMVMLGGYTHYTGLHAPFLDTVIAKAEEVSEDPAKRPTLVLTAGAQAIAASETLQKGLQKASEVMPVLVFANTGEFRRLMQMDAEWRLPHDHKWKNLQGAALEEAKQADDDYWQAKQAANDAAFQYAFKHFCQDKTPPVTFVVTNGKHGARVISAAGVSKNYAPPKPPHGVVNTVGGGDGFAGGYLLGETVACMTEAEKAQLGFVAAGQVIGHDEARLIITELEDGRSGLPAYLDANNPEHAAILGKMQQAVQQGKETEFKFLVANDGWKAITPEKVKHITQHYLPASGRGKVSVHWDESQHGFNVSGNSIQENVFLPVSEEVLEKFGRQNLAKLLDAKSNLTINDKTEARIRCTDSEKYVLTIKQETDDVASRLELEFPLEQMLAQAILPQCPNRMEKTRHVLKIDGNTWEVDVYEGENAGLVTAEIEAPMRPSNLPAWLGQEVTEDKKYANIQLAKAPFSKWSSQGVAKS